MTPPIADIPEKVGEISRQCQPPWRPIPSRLLGRLLEVSVQSLANWRVRGTGPEPEPMRRGKGNKIFYRPDKVIEWLEQGRRPHWRISADWLDEIGLSMPADVERERVESAIAAVDRSVVLDRYLR